MRQMMLPGHRSRRRLGGLAATAVAAALISSSASATASTPCPDAGLMPAQLTIQGARESVLCLINEQRAQNGLVALTINVHLQRAAQHHSKAMKKRKFFGHTGDGTPFSRVKRAGYPRGASAWGFGETLRWGKAGRGTPGAAVSAWMASGSHRSTLLTPGYRDVGIGVAMGSPRRGGGRNTAIYTVDLGYRR